MRRSLHPLTLLLRKNRFISEGLENLDMGNLRPHTLLEKLSDNSVYLILPLILYMSFFYVYPLLRMLTMSFSPWFTLQYYREFFETGIYLQSLYITLRISALVTLLCLLIGYPLAYYLSGLPPHKANVLLTFVLVPLWTSILVRTYAWIMILGRNGILNQTLMKLGLIDEPVMVIYNIVGVCIGMTHVMMPFMVLSLYSVMTGIDRNLLKAAQNLGARPFETFRRIFLPLSMPGIFAGSVLVFIISVGFFVTPALLGGRMDVMISMIIEQAVSVFLNWGFACASAFILLFLILVIFLTSGKMIGFEKLWGRRP
jgi:putative spermidine/putrescine transport system permease protein